MKGLQRVVVEARRTWLLYITPINNARRADIEYNGHDRNNPLDGPIARRLKEYGRVKAFVVGPRADMSSDLHSLINCISERAAEVRWRGMLAIDVINP